MRSLVLILATTLAACSSTAPPSDSVVLTVGGDSKSDSVGFKDVSFLISGERVLTDQGLDGEDDRMDMRVHSEVISQTDDALRVRADRILLGKMKSVLFTLESKAAPNGAGFRDPGTTMVFAMFARDAAVDPAWEPVRCGAADYAQSVLIDPVTRQIDVLSRGELIESSYTCDFASSGVPNSDAPEFAILPFPSNGWGSLIGTYDTDLFFDARPAL